MIETFMDIMAWISTAITIAFFIGGIFMIIWIAVEELKKGGKDDQG